MEPVTIDLSGVGELGPYVYLLAYILVTTFFGGISRRHIRLAGSSASSDVANAHGISGAISGALGIVLFIMTLVATGSMFSKSLESRQAVVTHREYTSALNELNEVQHKLVIARASAKASAKASYAHATRELDGTKLDLAAVRRRLDVAQAENTELIQIIEGERSLKVGEKTLTLEEIMGSRVPFKSSVEG